MLPVVQSCRYPRDTQTDPRLDYFYAISSKKQSDPPTLKQLGQVVVRSEGATLGAVVRDIAKQSGISIVYPQEWSERPYTGDLAGPADVVLDALSRLYDLRFQYQNGVGFIGKPLPDDRTIGVVQLRLTEPERVIQPLLSETGKITSANGWCFISDRAEVVLRVLNSLHQMATRNYCVQFLETMVDTSQDANVTISPSSTIQEYASSSLYDRQIDAGISSAGVFLGRSWLALVGEGRNYDYFLGETERREKVIITPENQIVKETIDVQTGFKLTVSLVNGILTLKVAQDNLSDLQYAVDAELPGPGLYLVHTSVVKSETRRMGFPSSSYGYRDMRRFIWVRYGELGRLDRGAPIPAVYDPASVPAAPRPH